MKSKLVLLISIASTLTLLLSFTVFKNKIVHDKKTGEVHDDDKVYYYMYPMNHNMDYSVKNLAKKEIFYIKNDHYETGNQVYNATLKRYEPEEVRFFTILFFNNKKTAEIPLTTNGNLARSFIENGLIKDGDLDTLAQERFILINEKSFSKNSPNNRNNTIIINENNNQQQDGIQIKKNGVNISIGN